MFVNEINIKKEYHAFLKTYKPQVTVFMLTHNRANYLSIAIDSILKQTYSNFFFLVLDNCSIDNTKEIVGSFSDKRLHYLYRESMFPVPNAQFALNMCETKYFIVLHDDDLYDRSYLETIVGLMEKSCIQALSVSPKLIDSKGETILSKKKYSFSLLMFKELDYLSNLISKHFKSMVYPSVIYLTEFYKSFDNFAGSPKIGYAGDQFIWLETCRKNGVVGIYDSPLMSYRIHDSQNSQINAGVMNVFLVEYLCSVDYYLSYFKKNKNRLARYLLSIYKSVYVRVVNRIYETIELKKILNGNAAKIIKKSFYGMNVWIVMWLLEKSVFFLRLFKKKEKK